MTQAELRVAIVVSFLNEAQHLPRFLASLDAQTQPPAKVVLVDDGSSDRSAEIADEHARTRSNVTVLRRVGRSEARDRLADAAELRAFQHGLASLDDEWDVVAKMDADLELSADLVEAITTAFAAEPRLGIAGSYLSVTDREGRSVREHTPPMHVRGPNKFYRRACLEQISPVPAILGWDTIDDLRARRLGWVTRSIEVSSGDSLHLRPTGLHDGRLKAFRRWGRCAWGYGAHPLWVLLGGVRRAGRRPYVLGGVSYVLGWCNAAVRRYPRAELETRLQARTEGVAELKRLATRRP